MIASSQLIGASLIGEGADLMISPHFQTLPEFFHALESRLVVDGRTGRDLRCASRSRSIQEAAVVQ